MRIPAGWWAQFSKQHSHTHRVLAGANEAWRIHTAGIWGYDSQLQWKRYEILNGRIDCSGSCQAPSRHYCSHTITENLCRAYTDAKYPPWTIAIAAIDIVTWKYSNDAGFQRTSVTGKNSSFTTWRGDSVITKQESEACYTCKLSLLYTASLASYLAENRFGLRNGYSSCIVDGTEMWIFKFVNMTHWKVLHLLILLCVGYFWISVAKL